MVPAPAAYVGGSTLDVIRPDLDAGQQKEGNFSVELPAKWFFHMGQPQPGWVGG
jgi:hypothetical protein